MKILVVAETPSPLSVVSNGIIQTLINPFKNGLQQSKSYEITAQ
jgi:hypothetical protein